MICPQCNGAREVVTEQTCPVCDGAGYTEQEESCSTCDGEGRVNDENCADCGGTGTTIARRDCPTTVENVETCPTCNGDGTVDDVPEPNTLIAAEFYCRFFDRFNNEIGCSGGYSSEDACRSAAQSAGATGYAWTMKPCGSGTADSGEIQSA